MIEASASGLIGLGPLTESMDYRFFFERPMLPHPELNSRFWDTENVEALTQVHSRLIGGFRSVSIGFQDRSDYGKRLKDDSGVA